MAHPKFLLALAALHVDVPDEAGAHAILDTLVKAANIEIGRIRWKPYLKLGPHSRMSFYVLIPEGEDEAVIAEIDRICTLVVGCEITGKGETMDFVTDGGDRHYGRIFDSRADNPGGFFAGTHWLDIEIDFYTPIQQRLRRFLREDRHAKDSSD